MKKLVALLLFVALLSACRKTRTCNCTVTVLGTSVSRTQTVGVPPLVNGVDSTTSQPLNSVNSYKKTYNKVKKKEMYANCLATSDETISRTSTQTVPGIYTITTTDSGIKSYDCRIEN